MSVETEDRARGRRRSSTTSLRRTGRLVGLSLLALVVVTELRKSPEDRTWNGRVLGCVPYDLRPVTLHRVRVALWSPEDPRLLLPRAFGVGWSPNVGRLVRLIRQGGRRLLGYS